MKMFTRNVFLFIILLVCIQTVFAQDLLSKNDLEQLLDKAEEQSQNYEKVFRNLSAEETKTKFYYKKDETLNDKRVIKSNFIVYQTPDGKRVREFRNVLEYNGKNVQRSDEKIGKFFEKLLSTKNTQKEYNRIKKEGTRFDGRTTEWGLTLGQRRPFRSYLREHFKFTVIKEETFVNSKVWKVRYEQTKPIPQISLNPTKAEEKIRQQQKNRGVRFRTNYSGALRPTNVLMKGTIWLDQETARIWKNEFELLSNPTAISKPITTVKVFFEYQNSDFGILIPKKFKFTFFTVKGKNDKTLQVRLNSESIYEYTKFKEFETDVKESDDKKVVKIKMQELSDFQKTSKIPNVGSKRFKLETWQMIFISLASAFAVLILNSLSYGFNTNRVIDSFAHTFFYCFDGEHGHTLFFAKNNKFVVL